MSTTDTACQTLTLSRIAAVHAASHVRHVDELSDDAVEQFYDLLGSDSPSASVSEAAFDDGEVIVFTDYYRVDLT